MKLMFALVSLSIALMGFLIFQAVRQEFHLRDLKNRLQENSMQVSRKEKAIVELKGQIAEIQKSMDDGIKKMEELKNKRAETEKSVQDLGKSLQDCATEKGNTEKSKASVAEEMTKLKADHEQAKNKAQGDIQSLKQQISDRDKAVCAFVDATKEEGRKLCGIPQAPQ